jgi:hypothetical protein
MKRLLISVCLIAATPAFSPRSQRRRDGTATTSVTLERVSKQV